ncbi:MAG: phosphoribosylformylglycinamidine synthase subunit PurS [Thaumarchaeota archaeon]|nr:phosphoribosylformylglycinamidine synthase subunit PurS [Nitrososphaerota archaeon]MDD9809339.1 phosphoribosylformylglycinamidine synthase subunit PurS [Nitrososphaerota archaeon]MDD9813209.1 phosphoribosylformylglycinamidine synthase subunit PurS [Nitrososphaerota archaeon]MDD9825669.1 phosphoribosylformylglycinamidine synthase subunit PurS [Nitrososphaerota archaeon]MDD9842950.1 phosphoribosylformylglycinamidine synthase subunit PurS [Nitrososphaerota archaeon]
MAEYDVTVTIENREGLADPEGETILRDLVLRSGRGGVRSVRTARILRIRVDAADARAAEADVERLCSELRLYNPLVSRASVRAEGAQ